MKVNMEGFKAILGLPNNNEVKMPLYDTMEFPSEESVKPLMVEDDKEAPNIECAPLVSLMVYQHSSLIGLDDHGKVWRLDEGAEEWKPVVSPLRMANKLNNDTFNKWVPR